MSRKRKYMSKATRRVKRRKYGSRRMRKRSGYNREALHKFRRWGNSTAIQGNVAYAPYLAGSDFKLTDVRNYAQLTSLFDQYKITHVQLRFKLRNDPAQSVPAIYPKLYYFVDVDDSNAAADLNYMRENGCTIRTLSPHHPVIVNLKPRTAQAFYAGGVFTSFGQGSGKWLDSSSPGIQHFGLKWAVDFFTDTNQYIDIEVKYWVMCRGIV